MIISFTIKNFRSFRDEAEFSFEAVDSDFKSENVTSIQLEDGEEIRLLKSAAIFGGNASGKSNTIWALYVLSDLVSHSLKNDVNTPIRGYYPYVLDSTTRNQPSQISIDFIVDFKHYRYEIVFNSIIHRESLSIITRGVEKNIFIVSISEKDKKRNISINDGWESEELDLSNAKLLPNQLLLSELGTREANGLQNVYSFLSTIQAKIVGNVIDLKFNSVDVAETILKHSDSDMFKRLRRLIQIADIGIEDISMRKHSAAEFKFPESVPDIIKQNFIEQNRWEFGMMHKTTDSSKGNIVLPMDWESTGTKNLFGVGARVLDVLEKGGVLAFDEINTAIHPALFQLIVSLFNNNQSNPNNAQLLFTTHDISIAGDGNLRADQVWFAEKIDGASQLYSAQDFEDINITVPFDRWYKSGRFGALPKFGNIDYIFEGDGTREKDNQ